MILRLLELSRDDVWDGVAEPDVFPDLFEPGTFHVEHVRLSVL